ncbi:hypothetical protein Tco_0546612 [Tanacetum coccineum]
MAKAGKPPTTFDELMSTPIDFSAYVLHNLKIENLTQKLLVGPAFNLLKGICKSRVELEFHFEECYKAVNDKLDWTNPEGHEYPFDLSKPLPLIKDQGHQVVPANYFFNNDLKYLKGGSLSSKYTTSTTKTKAAKYDTIEGIEDMWPENLHMAGLGHSEKTNVITAEKIRVLTHGFWCTIPTTWGKRYLKSKATKDIINTGSFMEVIVLNHYVLVRKILKSKHDVFSTKRIIAVTHVKVVKKYDYGYLDESIVRREDQSLHKFVEGDFSRLNLRVVILKRVEDLQLGVKSYQKKLNITRPETFRVLHDIASSLEMDYLPKRRWSKLDRKRCRIMIKAIDQQLFEKRLMRNLEKFVGGREYGNDSRLLERTI